MIDFLIRKFLWYNNIPEKQIHVSGNVRLIFYTILLFELIQSFLFPTISNLSLYMIFHDNIFVSWIIALNHVGSAVAGLLGMILSYMKLRRWLYTTPFLSTILIYFLIIFYEIYSMSKNKVFHIVWHFAYHTICSLMNISLTNLLVLSIKTGDKGPYFIIYNILMKLGHLLGPLIHLLVTFLNTFGFSEYFSFILKYYKFNYIYIFVTLFSLIKLYVTIGLNDPSDNLYEKIKDDAESGNDKSYGELELYNSNRYSFVPFIIFIINLYVTLGAGISIRFMDIYLMKVFNVGYTFFWASSIIIPILTSLLLFAMNCKQKEYGKITLVFTSYLIALIMLFIFIHSSDTTTVLVTTILRSVFQNAPIPIKTSIIIQCSKLSSAGYWLSADYITRIILAVAGLVGGQIVESYGFNTCFRITGLIYSTATLALLPCILMFPEI